MFLARVSWSTLAALILVPPIHAQASYKSTWRDPQTMKAIDEVTIDWERLPQEGTLDAYVKAVIAEMPQGPRLKLRIDEASFGNDWPRIAKSPVIVPAPLRAVNVHTTLRLAFRLADVETECAYGADGMTVRAAAGSEYAANYDVTDLVGRVADADPAMLRPLDKAAGERWLKDTPQMRLVRLMFDIVSPKLAIDIQNDRRLQIRARPSHHDEIESLLAALRRLFDVAVTVRAEVYSVESKTYARLEPVVAGAKRPAVPMTERQIEELRRQPLLLKSVEDRLVPGRKTTFISWGRAVRLGDDRFGQEGYEFQATPNVSADRTRVRLLLACSTSVPDQKNKGDVTMSLLFRSWQRDIEMLDGECFAVEVPYPAAEKDRRLVMLVQPIIYIGEEEQAIRGGEETLKVAPQPVRNP
jgi:hypothetical protein